MLLDQIELQHDVVPRGDVVGLEVRGICSVELVGHVDAVEPHLVRVRWGTMPEASLGIAWEAVELSAQGRGCDLVLFLFAASLVPEVKHVVTGTNVVQGVVVGIPFVDCTIC